MREVPTPNTVINEAHRVADAAMNELLNQEKFLHENGYHAYSAAVANMRCAIEKSIHRLADELS